MRVSFITRSTVLILGLGAALAAQTPPAPAPTRPASSDPMAATVVLKVPGMEAVKVRPDLVYAAPGGVKLAADLYLPPSPGASRPPVIVLVAGGAENTKAWGIYTSLGRLLAASGFAAVPFNHRLRYPRRQYEEGAADLLAVIAYLRSNAATLGIDGNRVAVAAFSGGGPMLSVMMRERPTHVRALAGIYAFLDTDHVDPAEAGTTPEVVRRFSPLHQFTSNPSAMPPLFIARAGRDEIPGVNESIGAFVAAALARNAPLTLFNHPAGAHGFEHKNDDARTREILRALIAFFHAHLS